MSVLSVTSTVIGAHVLEKFEEKIFLQFLTSPGKIHVESDWFKIKVIGGDMRGQIL